MKPNFLKKFNIIDGLLLALVLLSLATLVYKLTAGRDDRIVKNYLFTCVSTAAIQNEPALPPDTPCLDGDTDTVLGTLVQASSTDETKHMVFVSSVEGEKDTHGVLIDGVRYLKGKKLSLIVGDWVFEVTISDIQEIE